MELHLHLAPCALCGVDERRQDLEDGLCPVCREVIEDIEDLEPIDLIERQLYQLPCDVGQICDLADAIVTTTALERRLRDALGEVARRWHDGT